MPKSKEIENRIRTHSDLKDIVGAMKAFAGLNIKKTALSLSSVREYERGVREAIGSLAFYFPTSRAPLKAAPGRVVVVFGSDMGLCGGFNDRLADSVAKARGKDEHIFVIGRRLKDKLDTKNIGYAGFLGSVATVEGIRSAMLESFSRIAKMYSEKEVEDLVFVFSCLSGKMESAEVITERILPPEAGLHPGAPLKRPMMYLPPKVVLNEMIGEFLYISLYRCYIESLRTENWYRFKSMEGAHDNIEAKIKDLNALYKYSMQEEITEEMIEILQSHSKAADVP